MEQQSQGEGQPNQEVAKEASQEIDYRSEYEKLKSTNERLLEESKANKSRYQELKSMLEEKEAAKIEKAPADEKLKVWEEKAKKLEKESQMIREKAVFANLKSALFNIANDANDVSDLLSSDFVVEAVEVDEETLEVNPEKLTEAVNLLREKKPYLFKNQRVPKMASGEPKPNLEQKSVNQMSPGEKKEYLKRALQNWS